MRLHVLSDLHIDLRHNDWKPEPVDCDVVVCAGDVRAPLCESLAWLYEHYRGRPRVIYVPGNHDFYSEGDPKVLRDQPRLKTTWQCERDRGRKLATLFGIDLLDDSSVEIDGVRFLGATLWTDFTLRPPTLGFHDAVRGAAKSMNDYKLIKVLPGRSRDRLLPHDTIAAHNASVAFLKAALAEPFDGETVVVTHHAPSPRSLPNPEDLQALDCCYASDLEYLMQQPYAPSLWIHGHIHASRDYMIGNTRVLSNPRGYPAQVRRQSPDPLGYQGDVLARVRAMAEDEFAGVGEAAVQEEAAVLRARLRLGPARENPDFDPNLVVEVGYDCSPTNRM